MLNAFKDRQYNHTRITLLTSKSQKLLDGCLLRAVTRGYHSEAGISLASSTMARLTASETQSWSSGGTQIPASHISSLPSWSWGDKLCQFTFTILPAFLEEKRRTEFY